MHLYPPSVTIKTESRPLRLDIALLAVGILKKMECSAY